MGILPQQTVSSGKFSNPGKYGGVSHNVAIRTVDMLQQRSIGRLVQSHHRSNEFIFHGRFQALTRNDNVRRNGFSLHNPLDLRLLFRCQQKFGILTGSGGVDETCRHSLHRLLVASRKEHFSKERFCILAALQEACIGKLFCPSSEFSGRLSI